MLGTCVACLVIGTNPLLDHTVAVPLTPEVRPSAHWEHHEHRLEDLHFDLPKQNCRGARRPRRARDLQLFRGRTTPLQQSPPTKKSNLGGLQRKQPTRERATLHVFGRQSPSSLQPRDEAPCLCIGVSGDQFPSFCVSHSQSLTHALQFRCLSASLCLCVAVYLSIPLLSLRRSSVCLKQYPADFSTAKQSIPRSVTWYRKCACARAQTNARPYLVFFCLACVSLEPKAGAREA